MHLQQLQHMAQKGAQCNAISTSDGSQRGCIIIVVDCHDDQVINSSCFQISTTAATKCLLVTVLLEGQISHSSNNHVLLRIYTSANHLHAHARMRHGVPRTTPAYSKHSCKDNLTAVKRIQPPQHNGPSRRHGNYVSAYQLHDMHPISTRAQLRSAACHPASGTTVHLQLTSPHSMHVSFSIRTAKSSLKLLSAPRLLHQPDNTLHCISCTKALASND